MSVKTPNWYIWHSVCLLNLISTMQWLFKLILTWVRLPLYKDWADGRDMSGYKQWFIWNKFPVEWPTLRKISGLDEDNFTIPRVFHNSASFKIWPPKILASKWRPQAFLANFFVWHWHIFNWNSPKLAENGVLKRPAYSRVMVPMKFIPEMMTHCPKR